MAMFRKSTAALTALAALTSTQALAQNREPDPRAVIEPIIERFVEDYAKDPMAIDQTFGIEVNGQRWTVASTSEDGKRTVELSEGFGDRQFLYFTANLNTLNLLDQGVWNGLTAMGAATSADLTPLDIFTTEGYEKPANYDAIIRPLIAHFWTRGMPEVIPIGVAHSRVVHGAPATALYYDKDFRSAVYHIPGGLGREQAPTLTVPFPRMVIVTSGQAVGEIGGQPFVTKAGEMVFSPPNIPVTFWNGSETETLSFVWLMWGDGA